METALAQAAAKRTQKKLPPWRRVGRVLPDAEQYVEEEEEDALDAAPSTPKHKVEGLTAADGVQVIDSDSSSGPGCSKVPDEIVSEGKVTIKIFSRSLDMLVDNLCPPRRGGSVYDQPSGLEDEDPFQQPTDSPLVDSYGNPFVDDDGRAKTTTEPMAISNVASAVAATSPPPTADSDLATASDVPVPVPVLGPATLLNEAADEEVDGGLGPLEPGAVLAPCKRGKTAMAAAGQHRRDTSIRRRNVRGGGTLKPRGMEE
jgi:hypothetical protein